MTLLKNLEAEAALKRAESDGAKQAALIRAEQFETLLTPAMEAFEAYLRRLCDSLAVLGTKKSQVYTAPGYGEFTATHNHDFELSRDVKTSSRSLNLGFSATVDANSCADVEVQGISQIRGMIDFFEQAGVLGIRNGRRDQSGKFVQAIFKPRGNLSLSLRVVAERESNEVRLTLRNIEALGEISKTYPAEQFNEALFDLLGRYVARTDNELTCESLPDKYRHSLRTKLQQEQLRRKWEDTLHRQRLDEEARVRQEIEHGKLHRRVQRLAQSQVKKLWDMPLLQRLRGDKAKPTDGS